MAEAPLRGIAELVEVGGDGRHAGDAEVPGRDLVSQLLGERQEVASDAGVDVEADAALVGGSRHLRDGVNHAENGAGGRSDHQDGVAGDGVVVSGYVDEARPV